jgi:hypothetical protein
LLIPSSMFLWRQALILVICSIWHDYRDLDQLTVAGAMSKGSVKILVAVADVDAIVKKGSAIDDHAQQNTTSVYTAAKTFPMIPEKLSTDFTSLNYGTDRLAIVTGAAPKGTWVRLLHPPVEGKLVHGFQGMDVGRRIRIQLIHIDVEQGFIDFKKVE